MTTEDQAATTPEAQNNALDTAEPGVAEPGSTDAEGQKADASEEAKPEKSAEQKELERLRRQVTKSHRTQGRMHQETVELRERLAQLEQQQSGEDKQKPEIDPVKLAREIATVERVTEKANAIAKDGKKRFPDFAEAVTTLREEAGDLFDKRGLPTPVGEAILEADDPAALIQFLGANDDIAAELQGLSPTALGRKIARIEAQMNEAPKPKPASKASDPINPLRGTANATVKTLETMSQVEYEAHRKKQGARWGR